MLQIRLRPGPRPGPCWGSSRCSHRPLSRLGGGYPLPSRLGGLGERRELPQRGPGRALGRNRIWGILSVAELLWLKENQVFRETFITAYTSSRTVTGHHLAKIAPVHYSVNSNAKSTGEKPEIRVIVHITFCSVKIRDISLSRTEPFGTWDTASEFGTVPKNPGRLATLILRHHTPLVHNKLSRSCFGR